MLNEPSNVCRGRLLQSFDQFHFRTFLNYGKLLESVVFHSGRWGMRRAVRNGVLVRQEWQRCLPNWMSVLSEARCTLQAPSFSLTIVPTIATEVYLAFILVCSACLIKSWNHILCKLRNQIVAYVKMLSLFHLDENRKECVLWLMDTSVES